MKKYDVIVVGMGPGGSSAAYQLARYGYRVLGLEKARMPRYKPCGGCLSARVQAIIDDDLATLACEIITRVNLTFCGEGKVGFHAPHPIAYMVDRAEFDCYMANKATAAGAEIRDAEAVADILLDDDGYVVSTVQDTYHCRFLVGADGVNGVVGRRLGYGPRRAIAVALEGEVAVVPVASQEQQGTIGLDLGVIPHGYGWIFPKRDHWSLGVGSVKALSDHPRRFYEQFWKEQDIESVALDEARHGYRLPIFSGADSQISQGHSLLVGDAAALVDPFLGEGIYYAIRSGQLAAEAIHLALEDATSDLSSYQRHVAQEIYPEFEAAQRIAGFFYRFTRLGYALFQFEPETGTAFLEVLRGTLSCREYFDVLKKHVRLSTTRLLDIRKTPAVASGENRRQHIRAYDALDFLWRQTLAQDAWAEVKHLIQRHIKAGASVLDAGTGTGETAQMLLHLVDPGQVVGVDISTDMLAEARKKNSDARLRFEKADLCHLPFPDGTFDAVVSTWAIETLPDPRAAVREFLRVINDDGYVIYAFSSLPRFGLERIYSFVLEKTLGKAFDRRFLPRKEQPYHSCAHSSLTTFGNGIATVVVLRKCCTIDADAVPCTLPDSWEIEEIEV